MAAARERHHDGRPVATPQVSLGPKPAVPLEDLAAGLREMMGLEDNTSKLHAKKAEGSKALPESATCQKSELYALNIELNHVLYK